MAMEIYYPYLPDEVRMLRVKNDNPPGYVEFMLVFKDGFFTGEVFTESLGTDVSPDIVRKGLIKLFKKYVDRLEEHDERNK